MSESIRAQIQDTINKIVHLERVTAQLDTTLAELSKAEGEYEVMDKKLKKELRDIEKLEGLSTKAIFYKILGSKEKQVEKERQEYLELSLKEETLRKEIELLEYEVNLLEGKAQAKPNLEKTLEGLKVKREEEIIRYDPKLRNKLLTISNSIEENFRFKAELEEALEVGSICLNLINQTLNQLAKVRNWGQWSGNNRQHSMNQMMKRGAIDRARNLSFQVKHHLNLFEKELNDVGERVRFNLDPKSITGFSDFFFQNIITDWIMNQQLTKAINGTASLRDDVAQLISKLKQALTKTVNQLNDLNEKRDKVLLS